MKNKAKSVYTAFFLCLFLGHLGAHRFYLNRKKTALLMLMTAGGLGAWAVADLLLIISGRLKTPLIPNKEIEKSFI